MSLSVNTKKVWVQLSQKVLSISLRERGLLLGTLLALVIFGWFQFVYTPIDKKVKRVKQQIVSLDGVIDTSSELMTKMQARLKDDPNIKFRDKAGQLQKEILSQKKEIESRVQNLLQPEKMVNVVRRMLQKFEGLKLIRIRNLPVQPLLIPDGSGVKEEKLQSGKDKQNRVGNNGVTRRTQLYQHGLEIVLVGKYFDVVHYLERLEQVLGFSWEKMTYRVKKYPDATVTIRIQTISLDKGWIGV